MRALLTLAFVLAASHVSAQAYYGVLVYSASTGKAGVSQNNISKNLAKKEALAMCNRAGGKKCRTARILKNECGALAASRKSTTLRQSWVSWGLENRRDARKVALAECRKRHPNSGCKVLAVSCNLGK